MAEQALEIKDFSGGMTDNYIGGQINKFQTGRNLLIRSDLKIQSRFGGTIFDDTYNQVPFAGLTPKRVDSSYRFQDSNIYQGENKLYHVKASGFTEIVGPSGNSAFSASTVSFDQCSFAEWNNHLLVTSDRRERPKFIYKDGTDFRLRTLGLPVVDTSGITFGATGSASRAYAFVWAYTYTIDGIEFVTRGPVDTMQFTGALPHNITNLPVLANGANDSYDTANITLEIYRTEDLSDTFYRVASLTNGTTSYNDATVDADLEFGLLLYTDADDLDYDQPPECKYIVALNGSVYYLNIKDSRGDIFPNRIVQAAPDQPYAANEGNIADVDDDITGGAVAGQNVLVFTKSRTYRLEGIYDSSGRGGMQRVEISRTVGCISHKSVIQTLEGCYWAGQDGFYFSNGFQVVRISEDIVSTYSQSTSTAGIQKRIYGAYDPYKKVIYWAASSSSEQDDNDMIYVAHLNFGLKPDTPFTTWDGGYWPDNFAPSSLLFYDDLLLSGDRRGYLIKYIDGNLNDAKIDTDAAVADWSVLPVIYDLKSVAFDFGDVTRRKWVTKIAVYADSLAKVAFTIWSNNDNTGVFKELAEVRSNSPILWGDAPEPLWGDDSLRWNFMPIISGLRRFPRNNIRCSYKQIQITNAYVQTDSSEISGTVSIDAANSKITLNNASYAWDANIVDYYISFAGDDYETEYRVASRDTATEITVDDASATLVDTAAAEFKIRGYRKDEGIRLLSYSIIFSMITPTQSPYRAS